MWETIKGWFDKGEPTQTPILPMIDTDKVLILDDTLEYTPHAAQYDAPRPANKVTESERDRQNLLKGRK